MYDPGACALFHGTCTRWSPYGLSIARRVIDVIHTFTDGHALMRSNPRYRAPATILSAVRDAIVTSADDP